MSDDALIEAMARAIEVAACEYSDDVFDWTNEAQAALDVARPIIEAPLRAENEKLRAALKPFAETDIAFYADEKDYYVCTAVWFSLGQYRAAAAALKETGDE